MAKDFLMAGHVNIRIKHDDADWFSNDKEYHLGTSSNRGVTVSVLKDPGRMLHIDITGPLRFPQTGCRETGLSRRIHRELVLLGLSKIKFPNTSSRNSIVRMTQRV